MIDEKTWEKLREDVCSEVGGGYRYSHILGVEEECVSLAEFFGLDEKDTETVRLAGLLHDITKAKKAEEQKALYGKYGIPFGKTEINAPKTLHAVTGAYYAREKYPLLCTQEVFDCIYTHTTGDETMTLLQKIVYLADYIEKGRTFEACIKLRNAFWQNPKGLGKEALLKEVMLASFDETIRELMESGSFIHPKTVSARNGILGS